MRAGLLWMLLLASRVCLAAPAEVSFFNWSDYLPAEVLERFTAETGIRVRYSTYDSNEAMYAKLKLLSGRGYDLIVPSTYFIDRMGKEGLLRPLNPSQLPNFRFLDARHLDKPVQRALPMGNHRHRPGYPALRSRPGEGLGRSLATGVS
jgi:spermidine/putrescine transport system substrate-binding protein